MSKKLRLLSMLLALVMILSAPPVVPAYAQEENTLSTNITTPFRSDVQFQVNGQTVTSNSYRIPAMVTLKDGTIVAAADIRWNTTYDGGCLDTLVARSTDGGVSWTYHVANYLGDNGNVYNGSQSTAFIDPCLLVGKDGQTVYMLVDLYPYGVALNGSGNTQPSYEVGFDGNGNLRLKKDGESGYNYYLKDGAIYTSGNQKVEGYTVDAYFNIEGNGIKSNLFFADSPFKVVRTGYLYLTSSTDGGQNWSAPTLLNNIKTTSEQVCLVGPGNSITTLKDGTMIFPVYSYKGTAESQRLSFLYSQDGVTWERSAEFNYSWASEAAVIELTDGTLRFFFRNGTSKLCYVDYNMETKSWGNAVQTSHYTNSNTQISAITHTKQVDGKQVVLVSCPAGSGSYGSSNSGASYRTNGRIFVGVIEDNGTISWKNTIAVNTGNFMYSSLTERSDGSVAILYEDNESQWGAGNNHYYSMSAKAYSVSQLGITLDEEDTSFNDAEITGERSVYLAVGGTAQISGLTGTVNTSEWDSEIAGYTIATNGTITFTGVKDGHTALIVGNTRVNVYVYPKRTGANAVQQKVYINVDTIENCTVYYAINGGALHKVEGTGVLIDWTYTGGVNIMFFAVPDEGYALTRMNATGSQDQYYTLSNGTRTDGADSDAWPFQDPDATTIPTNSNDTRWKTGHGFRWPLMEGNMNIPGMRDLFTRALQLGADGATNFTRNNNAALTTDLTFIAQKLPDFKKEIALVNGEAYTEGMALEFGDVVTYRFTVTSYSTDVNYTQIKLVDTAIGYSISPSNNQFDTAGTYTYTKRYTINENDLDQYTNGEFVNTAELSYTYGSDYSSGTEKATDSASVSCKINGIVYYRWAEDVPQEIQDDATNYPLPEQAVVNYGETFQVEAYDGQTSYTVTEDGITKGTWAFRGWRYDGEQVNAGQTLTMPYNDAVEIIGHWSFTPAPTYRVTYSWTNAPGTAVLPVDGKTYYAGEQYSVDGVYYAGYAVDDGTAIWTFSGWKLDGQVVTGQQTMGNKDVTLVGSWTSVAKYTSLTIEKAFPAAADYSMDTNQTFLFDVVEVDANGNPVGDGVVLTVTIHGDGSIQIDGLTAGVRYKITEVTDWSWRYGQCTPSSALTGAEVNGCSIIVELGAEAAGNKVTFTNERTEKWWLDGDSWCNNIFK